MTCRRLVDLFREAKIRPEERWGDMRMYVYQLLFPGHKGSEKRFEFKIMTVTLKTILKFDRFCFFVSLLWQG